MISCVYDRPTIVRALLDNGANVTLTDENGETALHAAAAGGSVECAKMLLNAHVELLNVKDNDGSTALDIAVIVEKQDVGEYLRSRGGECNEEEYPTDWKDEVVAE